LPALGVAGNVTVKPAEVVLQKYPTPLTAVNPEVLAVVSQFTAPVAPKPVAVPLLTILAPAGIVKVSPLSPSVTPVPDRGVILFTFSSLIVF
jgi:hypothetical protein